MEEFPLSAIECTWR